MQSASSQHDKHKSGYSRSMYKYENEFQGLPKLASKRQSIAPMLETRRRSTILQQNRTTRHKGLNIAIYKQSVTYTIRDAICKNFNSFADYLSSSKSNQSHPHKGLNHGTNALYVNVHHIQTWRCAYIAYGGLRLKLRFMCF